MTLSDVFCISLYHGYIPQIILAEIIFTLRLRRRKNFWWILAVALPVYCVLAIVIPNIIAYYVQGLFSLTIFLLSLLLCVALFENTFTDILFCCISAQFTQNLSYNFENLALLSLFHDVGTIGRLSISVVSLLIVYLACYFAFARRIVSGENIRLGGKYIFPLAIVSALFVYLMQYLFQVYKIDQLWITRLPLIVCCVFGLCMQYGLLAYKDEQAENEKLEYFLAQSNRQYELTKSSIDLINMKAHDLKHFIVCAQKSDIFDGEEPQEIASAVGDYEKMVNSGNKALDVVLTEKLFQSKKYNIDLTMIVQGESLSFMHVSDLVSLFGNILDNAIEYEQKIEKEKRCISLKVFKKCDMICIHEENYCKDFPEMHDGLPVTTKTDKKMHGFGMKSIRYIVQKYDGTMQIGKGIDMYVLNILLPITEEKSSFLSEN